MQQSDVCGQDHLGVKEATTAAVTKLNFPLG